MTKDAKVPCLYLDGRLPKGFHYPAHYVELLNLVNIPYYEPWYFIGEFPENAEFWYNYMTKTYPTRSLVPFAKWSYDDDVVCFDATDHSGDPVVHVVHSFASPGWEDRGSFKNFAAWHESAKADHADFLSGRLFDEESDD
jgi:hypothetical protein